jgi:ATP-binding cassette subfamily G (WHITE) protein 2 (PDR)
MTVREAMCFNAVLCQPNRSRSEKLAYVEEIIDLLDMTSYANAVVGTTGEGKIDLSSWLVKSNISKGLNIEQRKKLTIAVELAARPELLLFLDEPSSGLDSQTSWAVLDLLEKLTRHGQAILCTIHQPSAALFERFDRLLFLAPEGKPVYFGNIGKDSRTVIDYFERNGASKCPSNANPAEWLMEIIGCTPGSQSKIDWAQIWRSSPEFTEVHRQLDYLAEHARKVYPTQAMVDDGFKEFAAPFSVQLWECLVRVNQQYWRTPSYIYSKTAMCIGSVCFQSYGDGKSANSSQALFLGFTFYKSDNSLQGLQDQTFNIFMLM